MDETVYKRDEKGKKLSKELQTIIKRVRFQEKSIDLSRTIKIGRDEDNDIVISNDPLVSRKHALIEQEGEDFYVKDKDSTNGTFVNNNPIPKGGKQALKSGDVITIGKTRLEIS